MNNNKSIATIDSPQFIDLHPLDISPLMSGCNIKVLYVGENRNGSFISKEVAMEMAKTLRGCPIVGYWKEEKEDFSGHGEMVTIDDDGEWHFSSNTVPYGFVSPVADIWFQKFIDVDDFGNEVEREYLVTQGFLWTSQYPEAFSAIEGKGQSMELDEKTIDGRWATNNKNGVEFFIINDATFSKLCILGDDVEPCFEGASIQGVSNYSQEEQFKFTLRKMVRELNMTLYGEGGLKVENEFVATNTDEQLAETPAEEVTFNAEPEEAPVVEPQETEEAVEDSTVEEIPSSDEEEVATAEPVATTENPVEQVEEIPAVENEFTVDEGILAELEELRAYKLAQEKVQDELEELRAYKLAHENEEKNKVIEKYSMLEAEDIADIVAHKDEYSVSQLEEKLAYAYVTKHVNFSNNNAEEEKEDVSVTFSLDNSNEDMADDADELHNALREFVL